MVENCLVITLWPLLVLGRGALILLIAGGRLQIARADRTYPLVAWLQIEVCVGEAALPHCLSFVGYAVVDSQ